MKIKFNYFKQLILESLLNEDKSRLIDKLVLPDIEDEEEKQKARDEMKAFFKKYNTWENKLDWNKLNSITYTDFKKIKDQATQTKGAQKREIASDIKSIFKSVGDRKFEIFGENANWLFVAPLTWQAAVYCDSSENQGAGAKWCIGYEESDQYWEQYEFDGDKFVMAFNKNYKSLNSRQLQTQLKFMIEFKNDGEIVIWDQKDNEHELTSSYFKKIFGDNDFFNEIHDKVYPKFDENGFVTRITNKEIKNNTYTPPKEAIGIDFSNFYWDWSLNNFNKIYIPKTLMKIATKGFNNFGSTIKVEFEPRSTPIEIGDYAFANMEDLREIDFPKTAILGNKILNQDGNHYFPIERKLRRISIPEKYTKDQKLMKQTLGNIDYRQVKIIPV